MESILVTGGAGFIGSNFVHQWIAEEADPVVTLDLLTYAGNIDSLADVLEDPRHRFVQGNICDAALLEQLIAEHRPRAIVHFAAESHVDRSIDAPAAFVQTNLVGTFTLLEAARAYWADLPAEEQDRFRFLHVSTDEVFGSLGPDGHFDEQTPYDPRSPYSASKAGSDHLVRAYYHTYGLPVIVCNCSNNYGPYQFPEKLVPLMILNALEGKPLPVYGDGLNVRDWLYVGDHCHALRTMLADGIPGETYNVGGDAEHTNLEVVHAICAAVDALRPDLAHGPTASLITHVSDRPGHDQRYAVDASKIRANLGWQPRESFESGLRETVAWYLEHPTWVARITSGSYQRERLGLGRTEPA